MRSLFARLEREDGLTLIEVLIVVLILGILAALVIPAVTGAATEARSQSKRSDLKEVSKAVDRFEDEFDVLPITEDEDLAGVLTENVKDTGSKDDIITIRIDSFGTSTQGDNDPTGSPVNTIDVTCVGTSAADAVDACFGTLDFDGLVPDFLTTEPEHAGDLIEATFTSGTATGDTSIGVDFSIANCNRERHQCDFILDNGDDLRVDGALSVWSIDKKKRTFAFKEDFHYGR